MDAEGNLYGTTTAGGVHDRGIVFKLTPSGTETVLYSFKGNMGGGPSGFPPSSLIIDAAGNLYGTTHFGGGSGNCKKGCGTVFKLTPQGSMTILHAFSGSPADGSAPMAGLIMDSTGNLYGTTCQGGRHGDGTVFKIAPSGVETVLQSFFGSPMDGSCPAARLDIDASGDLYGTTWFGGDYGDGTAFKVAPSGVESILHSFAGAPTDGRGPLARLILDSAGSLYGTTSQGGARNDGTVFKISPSGVETILHSFSGAPSDGGDPSASVTFAPNGNLFGTTSGGGAHNWGAVFEIRH